jgi:hypothetical protein
LVSVSAKLVAPVLPVMLDLSAETCSAITRIRVIIACILAFEIGALMVKSFSISLLD